MRTIIAVLALAVWLLGIPNVGLAKDFSFESLSRDYTEELTTVEKMGISTLKMMLATLGHYSGKIDGKVDDNLIISYSSFSGLSSEQIINLTGEQSAHLGMIIGVQFFFSIGASEGRNRVRFIQSGLGYLNHYEGNVDGIAGNLTESAARRYIEAKGKSYLNFRNDSVKNLEMNLLYDILNETEKFEASLGLGRLH